MSKPDRREIHQLGLAQSGLTQIKIQISLISLSLISLSFISLIRAGTDIACSSASGTTGTTSYYVWPPEEKYRK